MPSLRQSVATSTRRSASPSAATRSSRSDGGSRPVTASTATPRRRVRRDSATYSAVALPVCPAVGRQDSLARVREHAREEAFVVVRQRVRLLAYLTAREGRVAEVVLDIGAAALDELAGEAPSLVGPLRGRQLLRER